MNRQSSKKECAVETPVDYSDDIEFMKCDIDELEENFRCLKHEIKQLKSTPPAEQTPDDLSSLENDIFHMKYEVKRLKERTVLENIAPATDETPVETLVDNKSDIESLNNSANELEEVIRCLKHEMKQLKLTKSKPVEQTPYDLSPLKNDIGCLKYEVKKLKELPILEKITPAAVEKLVEKLVDYGSDIESMKDNISKLENAFRCLKHAMKQLKSTPKPIVVTPVDLSPLQKNIRCLKYEVKRLKERPILEKITPSVEKLVDYSSDIESLKNSADEFIEALRCLKHEMKKIKSTTPKPSAPAEQTQVDLSPLENDVRCLKYAIKRIKKRAGLENIAPVEKPVDHSSDIESMKDNINELEEALRCLKHEMKLLKSAAQKPVAVAPVDLSPLKNDVRCLKHEIKKLKKRTVLESIAPAAVEKPVDYSSDIESLKCCFNELKEAFRCLKYEIKQLKPTIPKLVGLSPLENDVICLKYEVKRLKELTALVKIAPAAVDYSYEIEAAERREREEIEAMRRAEIEAERRRREEIEARQRAEMEAERRRREEIEARQRAEMEAERRRREEIEARERAEMEAKRRRKEEIERQRAEMNRISYPVEHPNENIRSMIKQHQSKVVLNQNIQNAPEHIKEETKKIEQIILQNKYIQNNEIFIEIDYNTDDNQSQNTQKTDNNQSQNTKKTDDNQSQKAKDYPIPPPSKVVTKLPTLSQMNIIKNSHTPPPNVTTESLISLVSDRQKAEKLTKFNNLMLEKFRERNNQQQNNTDMKPKEYYLSLLRRRRRNRRK